MDEQTQFYYMMYPYVLDAMRKEGIDTAWASITTPQMMMEANWGKDPMVKYNNFFGMKADKSQDGVTIRTHEGYGDSKQYIDDKFLSFPSVEEGVKNGIIRLRDKFHAFEGEPSPEQYIKNINGTPGQIYFTEDPEVYLRNITSIRDGKRAQAAIEQYKKDEQQRKQTEIDKHISSVLAHQTDATRVNNPYPTQVDNTKTAAIGPYRDEYKVTSSEDRAAKIRAAVKAKHDYEKIMKTTNLKSTATEFKPKFTFDTGGFFQPKDAWDALSMEAKAEMMKVAINHGIYNLDDIRKKYNEFAEGGSKEDLPTVEPYEQREEVVITPDSEYNMYLNTLPDNQRFTPNDRYDSYLYWKLNGRPRNFLEAVRKGMFTYDHSDNGYHANSIAFDDDTGIGYFMKPKDHDTVGYELDWFNKGLVTEEGGKQRPVTPEEAVELNEFRRNYTLTDDPDRPNFFMYQPIERANGGKIHIKPENRGKFTALKERTGHSATWFKEHGTPAQKRMAVFALNSRKWKHGEGGNLFDGEL